MDLANREKYRLDTESGLGISIVISGEGAAVLRYTLAVNKRK